MTLSTFNTFSTAAVSFKGKKPLRRKKGEITLKYSNIERQTLAGINLSHYYILQIEDTF